MIDKDIAVCRNGANLWFSANTILQQNTGIARIDMLVEECHKKAEDDEPDNYNGADNPPCVVSIFVHVCTPL